MFRRILLILGGTVILSSLVTPPIYVALQGIWPKFPWPYSRVFDRVILVFAALLIFLNRRYLKIGELRGFFKISGQNIWDGILYSLCTGLIVMGLIIPDAKLDWAVVAPERALYFIPKVIVTAAVVSVLEEFIFRGVLYRTLQNEIGIWKAAIFSSALYAVVHFVAPIKTYKISSASPIAGLEYLGAIMSRLLEPGTAAGIFGLFLVGLLLCEAVRLTKNLSLAIGLHAGWIICAKSFTFLTVAKHGVVFPPGLGTRYYIVGQPVFWITLIAVYFLIQLGSHNNKSSGFQ